MIEEREGTNYIKCFGLAEEQMAKLIVDLDKTIQTIIGEFMIEGDGNFAISKCFEEGKQFTVIGGKVFGKAGTK